VENQVEFHHWLDYFDHTAFTSQFLAREHLGRYGNFEIAGLPTPLYHYGSYLFTAGLASFASMPAYQAVACFWTPFGTFLSGLAAYALATAFGGRPAGLCALIALLVLPDASYYGFKDPWFRYHWLQQIGSAGMYGVACLALAFLFLLEARRTRFWLLLAAGLAFTAATFFFKAQLFVVAVPLVIAWLILCYPRFSVAWRILLLQAVIVLAVGGIVVANKLQLGPRLGPDRVYFEVYAKYATAEGEKGVLRETVEKGAAAVGRSRYYLKATTLVVLSTFGGLLAGLPLLGAWAWWRRKLQAVDLVPWIALALYVVFLVGLKDNFAGVHMYELIHRPFVWPYFVLMVWCAGTFCVLLGETKLGRLLLKPKIIAVGGIIVLFLPWHMGRNVQQGKMSWRNVCYDLRFPVGMVRCARFVAEHGSRADLVQDSQCDDHLVFGSLAERRSYLARPELWKESQNAKLRAEIERRRPLLEQLKSVTTRKALQEMAAQTGIRWYLAHPKDRLSWPRDFLAAPAFCWDGFAVYDLGRLAQAAAE
jgi:hypothetical protein